MAIAIEDFYANLLLLLVLAYPIAQSWKGLCAGSWSGFLE